MIFFETNNLIADELRSKDAERFHRICNQPFILRWMDDWEMDLDGVKGLLTYFIEGYTIRNPEKRPFILALRTKAENKLVAICGFGSKDELAGKAEICYFIDEHYSNKGYMRQVIPKALNYYFTMTQNDFVSALVDEDNLPSKKILLHNGFCYFEVNDPNGILKSHYRRYHAKEA